jgi:hypothetical protein
MIGIHLSRSIVGARANSKIVALDVKSKRLVKRKFENSTFGCAEKGGIAV